MKHFKSGTPCCRGKAGVIYWDLNLTFIVKEQRDLFVTWLMSQEIEYEFEVSVTTGDSFTPDQYLVVINDMGWGNNLKHVASYLEEIDYNVGD